MLVWCSSIAYTVVPSATASAANDWSPDGRFLLYFNLGTGGAGDVFVLPMTGEKKPYPFVNSKFDERGSQFSPDGRWVAYQSSESTRFEIYVRPFPGPGGIAQVSTAGGIQVRWHPEGKELYYLAPDGKLMAVPIAVKGAAIEPGTPVLLFTTRIWGGGTNATNRHQYAYGRRGAQSFSSTLGVFSTNLRSILHQLG